MQKRRSYPALFVFLCFSKYTIMKKLFLPFLLILCWGTVNAQYLPDELDKLFVKRTLVMPDDYEGKVVCTIVKQLNSLKTTKAVLYVHGYNDYFYQTEMADRFTRSGYRFYAVDLRKYGRSLLPNQSFNNARNLNEYFADLDTVLSVMRSEGCRDIILIGHSTGGLISALYLDSKGTNLPVKALILNSPFFDYNESWFNEHIAVPAVSFLGKIFQNALIKSDKSTAYGYSLHRSFKGEWSYDLKKKRPGSADKCWSWIGAIHYGHEKVHKGLHIACPVLSMHSDRSVTGKVWTPAFQLADGVLDVKDIDKYSHCLGKDVTIRTVPGGMHDLILSKKNVRDAVYREMFRWLKEKGL